MEEEYEFPLTIYKGESEYVVNDEEALEFHMLQGWTVEKCEPVVPETPPVTLTDDTFNELRAEVAALWAELAKRDEAFRAEIDVLRAEIDALRADLPGAELIKGQGAMIARLGSEVNGLVKMLGLNPKAPKKPTGTAPEVPAPIMPTIEEG